LGRARRVLRSARWLQFVLVMGITAMIVAPASVWASHTFTDVPPDAFYHEDATALRNAGVTLGCTFDGSQYCPDDFVTRGQMAAFLNRLGALSPDKTPVVNADKLDGKDSSEFLTSASLSNEFLGKTEKAADADLLDGKDSSEFLGRGEKAADADLLDGKDSSEFLGKTEKAADADTVDGYHANQLIRADWFQTDYEPEHLDIIGTNPVSWSLIADPIMIVSDTNCTLLLHGNLDWDDNGTSATFDVQWWVNSVPVGPEYSGKNAGGENTNYTLVATAFDVVGPGTYNLELRGKVRQGGAEAGVESVGLFALCLPFDGGGNQVSP
jgi:hypothetical protein